MVAIAHININLSKASAGSYKLNICSYYYNYSFILHVLQVASIKYYLAADDI